MSEILTIMLFTFSWIAAIPGEGVSAFVLPLIAEMTAASRCCFIQARTAACSAEDDI